MNNSIPTLKEFMRYSRWRNVHNRIADNILSHGVPVPIPTEPRDFIEDYVNTIHIASTDKDLLREMIDKPKNWGVQTPADAVRRYTYSLGQDCYLYDVEYNMWDETLTFKFVELVGENKAGCEFYSYSANFFYDRFGMPGAIAAMIGTRL